jgi:hypothetical protein
MHTESDNLPLLSKLFGGRGRQRTRISDITTQFLGWRKAKKAEYDEAKKINNVGVRKEEETSFDYGAKSGRTKGKRKNKQ